jgi:hypothetical protein
MKIGILGAGNVGGSLGKLWAATGHDVLFGTRDPQSEKVQKLLAETGGKAGAGSIAEAASFGEVVVLSIGWPAAGAALETAGNLTGKIIIDTTNRFAPSGKSTGSAGEDVARLAPGAQVVKAFNTLGTNRYAAPRFGSQTASMFICGDNPAAKTTVATLTEELGFEVVDCGPLSNTGLLEAMGQLWVYLARSGMGRNHAFKLLRD